jgi:hypothetical protein
MKSLSKIYFLVNQKVRKNYSVLFLAQILLTGFRIIFTKGLIIMMQKHPSVTLSRFGKKDLFQKTTFCFVGVSGADVEHGGRENARGRTLASC